MNANRMLYKFRLFIFDANASYKDADAKCPCDAHVSFRRCNFHDANVPCRGCKCKVYPWWCQRTYLNCNANVSSKRWRCECLLIGMSWCKCPFIGMPWRECPLVGMQWMQMSHCGYIMTRMLWCKHNLLKKFLLFSKRGFHHAWNQNIFKLNLLFLKSHLPFDLRIPKKIGDHC